MELNYAYATYHGRFGKTIGESAYTIGECEMETKFKFVVTHSGSYTADSFLELIWIVFKHRCQHFLKGDGFVD